MHLPIILVDRVCSDGDIYIGQGVQLGGGMDGSLYIYLYIFEYL